MRRSADRLAAWHAGGRQGRRPPERLRNHPYPVGSAWVRRLIPPVYDLAYDSDGWPWRLRAARGH